MEYENNRLYGQSVMEYIERMSMASREDEPNSKERLAYYKALFYLNLEIEDEIKARKGELAQLKRVKSVFENTLIKKSVSEIVSGMLEKQIEKEEKSKKP